MSEAWFRRWMGFGYVPIRWEGWVTLAAATIVAVPSAILHLTMADGYPVASWIFAAVFVVVLVVQHLIVFSKLEHTYGN